ncbi:MAG TPA: hypothetical protein PK095_01715 [Myxococcota bacterium]|nr:hypothetical protein [Myxococcota bacterium]
MRTFRDLAFDLGKTFAAAAALTTLTVAPLAHAEDEGEDTESIVYAQRDIVLSTGIIRPEGMFSFQQPGAGQDLHIRLDAGADWAPIKNLQVGALAVPLSISPDADYGDPRLYVRYQLTEGAFQIAPELGFVFNKANILSIGAPMRFKINPAARIDVSPMFLVDLPGSDDADGTETRFGLSIPVEVAISLTRSLYLAVMTGFELADFDGDGVIPLGLQFGYSLPSAADTAWIDLFLDFRFNAFIPLADGADVPYTDYWTLGLGARFHFGLE